MKALGLAMVILAIGTSYPPLAAALGVIGFVVYVFWYIGATEKDNDDEEDKERSSDKDRRSSE